MTTKRNITDQIEDLSSLKNLIETYEEIAASRIRITRESVLKSRFFIDDLNLIFSEVKSSYRKEILLLMKQKNVKHESKLTFIVRNGKTLNVLVSANTGLYGNIIKETFNLFLSETKNNNCDVVIIGKQGLNLFLNEKLNRDYEYFDFPDSTMDDQTLKKIIGILIKYEKIVVFFGRFQSIFSQKSEMSDISGNIATTTGEIAVATKKYFFEPSIEKILAFFEQQIFASIFEQTIKESSLAKFASRLITLNTSAGNIKNNLHQLIYVQEKLNHDDENKKQLQTFSSMRLWKK